MKNKLNKEIFTEYIQSLQINEKSLIVDIGYAGSLQKHCLLLLDKRLMAYTLLLMKK